MAAAVNAQQGVLALYPFFVVGMLPLGVMREMRRRGLEVWFGRYLESAGGYSVDACDDLRAAGRLLPSVPLGRPEGTDFLEAVVDERCIQLILNFGAPWAYAQLSALKERRPGIRILDTLYNPGPHFHSFSSYHPAFDGVIVESEDMVRRLGEPGWPPVFKVESGIDLDRFAALDTPSDTLAAELTVGFLGRMSPEKNPLGFVELAEQLHQRRPGMRFKMFGEGPLARAVSERAANSPAAAVISFEGFVDHPASALAQLDVIVVPSRLDGRPAVVMEASACGVPVIGAPVGGIPELIEEGRNGFVVAPKDVDRISALISEWSGDRAKFASLRSNARRVAEERFGRTRMMDRYERVYREVLNCPARPPARAPGRA
jgi:glycosyltransferase involved in cell wall biosynthesis